MAVLDAKDKSTFYRVSTEMPGTLTSKAAEAGLVQIDPERLEYHFERDEADAMTFLKTHNVNLAVISVDHLDRERMESIIDVVGEMGIDSMVTLDSFAMETFDSKMEDFGTLEVVRFAPRIFSELELFFKRIMDILGALVGCVFTLII